MNLLKSGFRKISKAFRSLPKAIQIGYFTASSTIYVGITALLLTDIEAIQSQNEYVQVLLAGILLTAHTTVDLGQYYLIKWGEELE